MFFHPRKKTEKLCDALMANDPDQAGRANDVQLSSETWSRPGLEPVRQVSSHKLFANCHTKYRPAKHAAITALD
jgi:hypothetical protein